jgi:hypothetical protein
MRRDETNSPQTTKSMHDDCHSYLDQSVHHSAMDLGQLLVLKGPRERDRAVCDMHGWGLHTHREQPRKEY